MPNWVSNSVRVTGDKDELQRFAEQAGKPGQFRSGGESLSPLIVLELRATGRVDHG